MSTTWDLQTCCGGRRAMTHSEVSMELRGGWWWSCSVTCICRRQLVTLWWAAEPVLCLAVRRVRAGEGAFSDVVYLDHRARCCCPKARKLLMTLQCTSAVKSGHVQQDGAPHQLQLQLLHVLKADKLWLYGIARSTHNAVAAGGIRPHPCGGAGSPGPLRCAQVSLVSAAAATACMCCCGLDRRRLHVSGVQPAVLHDTANSKTVNHGFPYRMRWRVPAWQSPWHACISSCRNACKECADLLAGDCALLLAPGVPAGCASDTGHRGTKLM